MKNTTYLVKATVVHPTFTYTLRPGIFQRSYFFSLFDFEDGENGSN